MRNSILFFLLFSNSLFASANTGMRVHFIDVGQGDATLFEFPCGAVLVDTGGESNNEFNSKEALLFYLDEYFNRRADLSDQLTSLIKSGEKHDF